MSVAPVPADPADEVELDLFLEALHRRWHYDFRSYSRASLVRRADLARERLGCATLSDLQGRLLRDPLILPDVIDAMTVQVSELFRDPSYYLALRREVVPHLRTFPSLKVWVAGCANGEEFYSLAILFREAGLEERTHFYCTDISRAALAKAEAASTKSNASPGSRAITSRPADRARCRTTTQPATVSPASIPPCVAAPSSRTTTLPATRSSPRSSWFPAATS